MRTIFKYSIGFGPPTHFMLPKGAKVVRFAEQRKDLYIWVELKTETTERLELRAFIIVGTGHQIPTDAVHCGSCEAGPFIWHLYEVPVKDAVV